MIESENRVREKIIKATKFFKKFQRNLIQYDESSMTDGEIVFDTSVGTKKSIKYADKIISNLEKVFQLLNEHYDFEMPKDVNDAFRQWKGKIIKHKKGLKRHLDISNLNKMEVVDRKGKRRYVLTIEFTEKVIRRSNKRKRKLNQKTVPSESEMKKWNRDFFIIHGTTKSMALLIRFIEDILIKQVELRDYKYCKKVEKACGLKQKTR